MEEALDRSRETLGSAYGPEVVRMLELRLQRAVLPRRGVLVAAHCPSFPPGGRGRRLFGSQPTCPSFQSSGNRSVLSSLRATVFQSLDLYDDG